MQTPSLNKHYRNACVLKPNPPERGFLLFFFFLTFIHLLLMCPRFILFSFCAWKLHKWQRYICACRAMTTVWGWRASSWCHKSDYVVTQKVWEKLKKRQPHRSCSMNKTSHSRGCSTFIWNFRNCFTLEGKMCVIRLDVCVSYGWNLLLLFFFFSFFFMFFSKGLSWAANNSCWMQ